MQDNVKDPHEGSGVSISLHNLEKKYKGTQGLAQLLFSNTKVQNLTVSISHVLFLVDWYPRWLARPWLKNQEVSGLDILC